MCWRSAANANAAAAAAAPLHAGPESLAELMLKANVDALIAQVQHPGRTKSNRRKGRKKKKSNRAAKPPSREAIALGSADRQIDWLSRLHLRAAWVSGRVHGDSSAVIGWHFHPAGPREGPRHVHCPPSSVGAARERQSHEEDLSVRKLPTVTAEHQNIPVALARAQETFPS